MKAIYISAFAIAILGLVAWLLFSSPQKILPMDPPHLIKTTDLVLVLTEADNNQRQNSLLACAIELNTREDRPENTPLLIQQQLFQSYTSPTFSDRKAALLATVSHPEWAKSPPLKELTKKTAEEMNKKYGRQIFRVVEVGDELKISANFKMSVIK